MAVNPVQFLVASNASILDGTKTISISGNVDCSRVYSGTAVFLGGADNPAEAVSGTSPDGSGVSTITLRNNWSQGDVSNQPLVSFNTNEGLAEAISNVREIVSNVSAIEDLATQGLIKRIDDNTYEVVNITTLGESLVEANDAGTARSVLGLGSAATKNVGTSSGNIMEVGSFGLGGTGKFISLTDWHQLGEYETGFYTSFQSAQNSVNNSPPITTSNTNYTIFVQRDGVRVKITAYVSKGVQAFTKTYTGSAWTDWFENYDSGNSVNPLDYGLSLVTNNGMRDSTGSIINDLNLSSQPNQFFVFDSATANRPKTYQGLTIPNGVGITMSRDADIWGQLTISRAGASLGETVIRAKDGTNIKERTVFDSGNTNFNEFKADGQDVISFGEMVTASIARFYLPINSHSVPSSFTVNGTFRVLQGGSTLATGIVPSPTTLSSPKVLVIEVSGLSSSAGLPVNLRTDGSASKITVNF